MPDTLDFSGNLVTFLGLIGVTSTLVIYVVVSRTFWSSPFRR
jgi:hypothetical protein